MNILMQKQQEELEYALYVVDEVSKKDKSVSDLILLTILSMSKAN